MLFFSIILLLLFLSFFYDYKKIQKNRNLVYWSLMIFFILISGLRYRVGGDTINYHYLFTNTYPTLSELVTLPILEQKDAPGSLLLFALVKSITGNFYVLQFLISAFFNIAIFCFFYNNSKNIFTCILLYFCCSFATYNFEVLRESIAIGFFLFAFKFFITNKWYKYYFLCLIASSFHYSALFTLFLPLTQIPGLNIFFKFNKSFILSCAIIYIIISIISTKFFDIINLIQLSSIQTYSAQYEKSDLFGGKQQFSVNGFITFFLTKIIFIIIIMYFLTKLNPNSKKIDKINSLLCVYLYLSIFGYFIVIVDRFNNYLLPFVFLSVSSILYSKMQIRKFKYKLSYSLWMLLIFPYLFLPIYGMFKNYRDTNFKWMDKYYPYSSIIYPVKYENKEGLFRILTIE